LLNHLYRFESVLSGCRVGYRSDSQVGYASHTLFEVS
jgi:hypothetical protein